MRATKPTLVHVNNETTQLELDCGITITRDKRPKLGERWVGYFLEGLEQLRPLLRDGDRVISSRGWSVVNLQCEALVLPIFARSSWDLSGEEDEARK